MEINAKRTKLMCISHQIYVDGKLTEQVKQFRYLDSLLTESGYCHKEQ